MSILYHNIVYRVINSGKNKFKILIGLDLSFNMIYCMLRVLHRNGQKQDINRDVVNEKQIGESVTVSAVVTI